jgi:hypothetical protein
MNTIRKTHAGHWADNSTRFADLGAGVSHRQAEGAFVCSPRDESQDESTNGRGFVTLGRVLFGYLALMAVVVLLVRYFLKA